MKISIGKDKLIYDYKEEELLKIKEDLTLENPAYKQALRFSKWGRTKIPKHLFYYTQLKNAIIVPRGYNIPFEHFIEEDNRIECTVDYPSFKLSLRDTQKDAVSHYLEDTDKGLIVLPTGKGKSILGLHLAHLLKQRTLVIVHKDDLVDGWTQDSKICFGEDFKVGIFKAKRREVGEQITIATIQTLNRISSEQLEKFQQNFGMVIVDECLARDTLIALEDGGFKTIESVNNTDQLLGGEVSNKFSRLSNKYIVQTSTTRLEGSPTHPTWIWSEDQKQLIEKPLKDIKVGDYIPNILTLPHTSKKNWTAEQLSLVALIQTDGHIDKNPKSKRVKVNVSKDFAYYSDLFTKGVKAFGDFEVKKSFDIRGNMTIWCNDPRLKDILTNTFAIPVGKKSTNLIINEEIQYSPLSSIKAYIETLFSTEGDLNLSKSARMNIGMCSKQFIQGLSLLLRKFSIVSNYQVINRGNENHNTLYRLSLSGHFFNEFMNTFSLIPRKHTPYRNPAKSRGKYFEGYYMTKVTKSYITNEEIEVFDFTTTSHSFIANGVKTHNCHHISSSSFDLLHKFSACYKVGLSATPERSDGLTDVMYYHLGDCAFKYEADHTDKDILPVHVKARTLDLDVPIYLKHLGGVKYELATEEDINNPKSKLKLVEEVPFNNRPRVPYFHTDNEILTNDKFAKQILRDIISEYNNARSIVCFFSQKKHIEWYKENLVRQGIPSDQILLYYGDAKESKEDMKKKAESKQALITLATYSIATEGTNVKAWEVCFLISSINNEKNVEQAVGRVRRSKEGKINPVLVYDYLLPNVYSIGTKHYYTRQKRYKKLGFKITKINGRGQSTTTEQPQRKSMFTRGF